MKKFERLSPQQRKQEIRSAALALFLEKGVSATTMENIISRVTLSKGGVYRLYSSTDAILADLMLEGMHLRNAWYRQQLLTRPRMNLEEIVGLVGESLVMYPEYSRVYAEFLWEKQRNPRLEELYQQICRVTVEETLPLIRDCGCRALGDPETLRLLTDLMNSAVLSMHTLGLREEFIRRKDSLCRALVQVLSPEQKEGETCLNSVL